MPHRSHLCTIVVDVRPDQLDDTVTFWGGAIGKEIRNLTYPEFHGARLHDSLVLLVQELGNGEPRVHLDIHTDDVDAEVARLESLGAAVVDRHEDWTVMHDPAGLPFCVVKAPEGSLETPDVITWP